MEVYDQCQWGTVLYYDWSIQEAHVVCRQLGYPSASQTWRRGHFGRGTGPLGLYGVTCHGNESNIQECKRTEPNDYGYYSNVDVGVTCDQYGTPPSKGYFFFVISATKLPRVLFFPCVNFPQAFAIYRPTSIFPSCSSTVGTYTVQEQTNILKHV